MHVRWDIRGIDENAVRVIGTVAEAEVPGNLPGGMHFDKVSLACLLWRWLGEAEISANVCGNDFGLYVEPEPCRRGFWKMRTVTKP